MFIPKGTFKKLIEESKIPEIKVYCNECKYQNNCIKQGNIEMVRYSNGEKGYAKTYVHHFDNNCSFPIEEYNKEVIINEII